MAWQLTLFDLLFIFICRMNDIFNLAGIIERINIKKSTKLETRTRRKKEKNNRIIINFNNVMICFD